MSLGQSAALWLLLFPGLPLVAFISWAWYRKKRLISGFVQSRLLSALTVGVSFGRQKFRLALLVIAYIAIVFALARPQWGWDFTEASQQGIDVLVALDTSKSMWAADVTPDRFTRARLGALELARMGQGDRFGLIPFAGSAFLQCPLTTDEGAFRQNMMAVEPGIIPQGGSLLSAAIETAIRSFDLEAVNHRLLILFTDGEDHDSDAVQAAKRAAAAKIRIITVGVGTPEGELIRHPSIPGQFMRDENQKFVRSRLNEELLREIAIASGGFYVRLDNNAIQTVYEKGIAPLPKTTGVSRMVRVPRERFHGLAAAAIVLLLIEMFVPSRRRRVEKQGTPQASLAAAVALSFMCVFPAGGSPLSAQKDFRAGRFREAAHEFEAAWRQRTNDQHLAYNAGASAYRSGDYARATNLFESALTSHDLQLQQKAYYNLGNTLFRAGEQAEDFAVKTSAWSRAISQFANALQLKTNDMDAGHNLELVRRRLEELQLQQQKNNPQGDKEENSKEPKEQPQGKDDSKKQEPSPGGNPGDKQNLKKPESEKPGEKQKEPQKAAAESEAKDGPNKKGQESSERPEQSLTSLDPLQMLDGARQGERPLIFAPPAEPKHPREPIQDW